MGKKTLDTSTYCCPNEECSNYGRLGPDNQIKGAGRYGKKREQLLQCKVCGKTFSVRRGTPLFNLKADEEDFYRVIACLAEGNGIRAAGRIVGRDKETVASWLKKASTHVEAVNRHFRRAAEWYDAPSQPPFHTQDVGLFQGQGVAGPATTSLCWLLSLLSAPWRIASGDCVPCNDKREWFTQEVASSNACYVRWGDRSCLDVEGIADLSRSTETTPAQLLRDTRRSSYQWGFGLMCI
jgi:transposase-like protein